MRMMALTLICVAACSRCAVAQEDRAQGERIQGVRETINRALPHILKGGMEWRTENDCTSCHRTTFTAWALNRATELGLSVNEDTVRDWNSWSRNWENHVAEERRDEATREATLLSENDSVAQLLLGRPKRETDDSDWVKQYRSFLAKSQNKNGSWRAGGQLPAQKRPQRETQEVSTMWALVALSESEADKEVLQAAMSNASKWLGTETHGTSIEWWATNLLLQTATEDSAAAAKSRQTILHHQNDDGGWGWLVKDKSDALGTGIVLYALAKSNPSTDSGSVKKAITFLQQTQDPDGSWPVNGTKKNGADHVTDTAAYWGTCWAVIGMCESVPNEGPSEQ